PGTGYSTTGQWTCSAGGTLDATKTIVTVDLGANVTCSITNTDDKPTLKLTKIVTNNDGGTAVAADYTLSATAVTPNNGRNFSDAGNSSTFHDVFANAAYTLAESPNPGTGYSTTGQWTCSAGGTLDATKTIVTVDLGANVTCSITNTDDKPTLKLTKIVTNNDGGTAVAADYTLSATAVTPNNGRNFSDAGNSSTFHDVFANAAYTLAESPNPGTGYSTTGQWTCSAGGTLDATKTIVTVDLGANVTCSITNTDDKPTLKLTKIVTNNDGGTAVAADYTLSATAVTPNNGRNFSDAGNSSTFHDVFAHAAYTLAESPNPGTGYSTTGQWTCSAGGTLDATKTIVTVDLGANVTCSITNTDDKPTLKLTKIVTNNDGGTAVAADYTLSATAVTPNNGRNFSDAGNSSTFHDVFANAAYTLAESPNPGTGYSTTGQWTCSAGGTLDATKTIVTVDLGANVTCSITNTDDKPTLKLTKIVTNNDGGTAVAADYTLSATAVTPNNGRNFSDAGNSSTFHDVFANAAYTLAESPNPGTGYSTTGQWTSPARGPHPAHGLQHHRPVDLLGRRDARRDQDDRHGRPRGQRDVLHHEHRRQAHPQAYQDRHQQRRWHRGRRRLHPVGHRRHAQQRAQLQRRRQLEHVP